MADRTLKCGSKPLWGGLTGFGVLLMLVGGIVFVTHVGLTCCDAPTAICEGLERDCEACRNDNNCLRTYRHECDEYGTLCSDVVMALVIGSLLIFIGNVLTSVFMCGICACCCFEGPRAGVGNKQDLVVGQVCALDSEGPDKPRDLDLRDAPPHDASKGTRPSRPQQPRQEIRGTRVDVVQGSPERLDPGHWTSTLGGMVMVAVIGLATAGLGAPWWTDETSVGTQTSVVEVSLWTRYTRSEFMENSGTLNCAQQCDVSRRGAKTVRENKDKWSSVCDKATDKMAEICTQLWVVRVAVLTCWFCAVLYSATSVFTYLGAGNPASCRVPSACVISLAFCGLAGCIVALIVAGMIDITLAPPPPTANTMGTPQPTSGNSVDMNGIGYTCVMVALFVSLAGVGVAFCHQAIMSRLHRAWEFENGRPLADQNRAAPPDKAPQKEPSRKIDNWVSP